jgi:hypothetical protein
MVLARLSIVNRKALQWATGAAELRTKAVVFPEWLPFSGVAVAKSPLHHEWVNERNRLWLLKNSITRKCPKKLCNRKPHKRLSRFS